MAEDRSDEREALARAVRQKGVRDPRVLDAIRTVPRHRFVPEHLRADAYTDGPLPIGRGQVITQPSLVAEMMEAADLRSGDRALEIGTGSGYGAAILSRLVGRVYTIERYEEFAEIACRRFRDLGYANIEVTVGDGTRGWREHAPFDAIIVTAGSPPEVPEPLLDQLATGGGMVVPVGETPREQDLYRIVRTEEDELWREDLRTPVRFVPLVGDLGWQADQLG